MNPPGLAWVCPTCDHERDYEPGEPGSLAQVCPGCEGWLDLVEIADPITRVIETAATGRAEA